MIRCARYVLETSTSSRSKAKNAHEIQAVKERGYEENVEMENVKLGIMVVSCAFAAAGHFVGTFPDNRIFLGCMCVAYFVGSGVLQFIMTFIDKDYIYISKPKEDLAKGGVVLGIRSDMKRFDEHYELKFEKQDEKVKRPESERLIESSKKSIGNYFDYDGYFAKELFLNDVLNQLKRFEKRCAEEAKSN